MLRVIDASGADTTTEWRWKEETAFNCVRFDFKVEARFLPPVLQAGPGAILRTIGASEDGLSASDQLDALGIMIMIAHREPPAQGVLPPWTFHLILRY